MKIPQYYYSDEYKRAHKKAVTFSIVSICLLVPLIALLALIGLYNAICGGLYCDGPTAMEYCYPTTAPGFFSFLFIWFVIAIVFVVLAIVNIVDAKKKKIPILYSAAEIAMMERQAFEAEMKRQARMIYIPEYYKHQKKQTVFSIVAGGCGTMIMGCFFAIIDEIKQYYDYSMYTFTMSNVSGLIFYAVLHLIAVIVFVILANRERVLKNKNRILKNPQPTAYPQGQYMQQNPYGQSPYNQNPYGQSPYSRNPYGQSPYNQNPYGQSPYNQNPYGQSPYDQNPYDQNQNVQNSNAQDPYGRN